MTINNSVLNTKTHETPLVQGIFLLIIAATFTILHFYFTPSVLTVIITLLGSIVYLSFIQINRLDIYRRFDHIQSGEGPLLAALAILLISFKFSFLVTGIAVYGAAVFMSLFQKFFIEQKPGEIFFSGIILNTVSLLMISYILYINSKFSIDTLLYGYFTSYHFLAVIGATILSGIILMMLFPRIRPVFQMYTHGSTIFSVSGISYTLVSVIITLIRSLFLTITLFSTGFCSGIGNYIYSRESKASEIISLLIIISYSQALFLLIVYFKIPYIILLSIFLSYIIYNYIGKKTYYKI